LISVHESILASIVREANDRFPRETGGILLGRWVEPKQAVVTRMIGPGPRAKHGKATFEPDYEFQEAEIAKTYACSDLVFDYLGDWHSHPRGSSHPSQKDVRVLRKIAGHAPARCKDPIMCIVSGWPFWVASAWSLVDGHCLEIQIASIPDKGWNASTETFPMVG